MSAAFHRNLVFRSTVLIMLFALCGNSLLAQQKDGQQQSDQKEKIPAVVPLGKWRNSQMGSVLVEDYFKLPMGSGPVKSAEDAAKLFRKETLKKWNKQIDFAKQELVVWRWSGSGQDHMECYVSISDPKKVMFYTEPGRTKDLVDHLYVFAVRKDVKWQRGPNRFYLPFNKK